VCTPQSIVELAESAGVFDGDGQIDGVHAVEERFTMLCERAAAGDARATAVLERAAGSLAVLIAVLTNMLDVDRVVLGGPFWDRVSAIYLRVLPGEVHRRSATRGVREIPVTGTIVGDDVGAVGAACVVLDQILTPRASDLYLREATALSP
jgi:predicted NBD/HSP70 family sugar kinase